MYVCVCVCVQCRLPPPLNASLLFICKCPFVVVVFPPFTPSSLLSPPPSPTSHTHTHTHKSTLANSKSLGSGSCCCCCFSYLKPLFFFSIFRPPCPRSKQAPHLSTVVLFFCFCYCDSGGCFCYLSFRRCSGENENPAKLSSFFFFCVSVSLCIRQHFLPLPRISQVLCKRNSV